MHWSDAAPRRARESRVRARRSIRISKQPELKHAPVRVERVRGARRAARDARAPAERLLCVCASRRRSRPARAARRRTRRDRRRRAAAPAGPRSPALLRRARATGAAARDARRGRQRHGRPSLRRGAASSAAARALPRSSCSARSRAPPTTACTSRSCSPASSAERSRAGERRGLRGATASSCALGARVVAHRPRGARASRPTTASASRTTRWCSPPARAPFVPPVPGIEQARRLRLPHDRGRRGDPRDARRARARGIVIGGGLLGLEAAKALRDLGLETHVVEAAPRLMPRQLDDAGSAVAGAAHRGARRPRAPRQEHASAWSATARSTGLRFADGSELGGRPRGDLGRHPAARRAGAAVRARRAASAAACVVDDELRTSDPRDLRDRRGRAAPRQRLRAGRARATRWPTRWRANLCAAPARRRGASRAPTSRRELKLLGVDVASLGDPFASRRRRDARQLVFARRAPRRLRAARALGATGDRLVGGVLVGDTTQYPRLLELLREGKRAARERRGAAVRRERAPAAAGGAAARTTRAVCSCNNVSARRDLRARSATGELADVAALKKATQGRHRLRRLPAAGDAISRRGAGGGRARRREPPVRALRLHAPGAVPDRARSRGTQSFEALLASHGQRRGLRDLQAGRRVDPREPVERADPRARRRSRTPTTASSPTSSAAAPTRWCRACRAARSRPRS